MPRKSHTAGYEASPSRLNKSTVAGAALPSNGRRTTIWDAELKGFGVRITASGRKTYVLRYRMGGRDTPIRTVTIGQHGSPWTTEQARKRAVELLLQVRSGRDVVAEQEVEKARTKDDESNREARMFGTMADSWFRKHVERDGLRSSRDIHRIGSNRALPLLEGTPPSRSSWPIKARRPS